MPFINLKNNHKNISSFAIETPCSNY